MNKCHACSHAEYYRVVGDFGKAQKDLDEAFSIATRGGMGLFVADCHLGFARLQVARFKVSGSTLNLKPETLNVAREHLETAKQMINQRGYHRRDKEVEELEKLLS